MIATVGDAITPLPEPTRRRLPGLARTGAAMVAGLALLAVVAPLLSPHDPNATPDPASARLRPPGTELAVVELAEGRTLLVEFGSWQGSELTIERNGVRRTLPAAAVRSPAPGEAPALLRFPLGTDKLGRDIAARLLHGARVSLTIGVLSVLLSLSLGVAIGGIAGSAPALVDSLLMRTVDALLAFPRLFLVLAFAGLFGPSLGLVVLVLGGTGWMGTSRLVRAEVANLRQRDFVVAARGLGQRGGRILIRHLLPNALPPALVDASLRIADAILIEAALSFLGLGVQPPTPSWGSMVADGRDVLSQAWWVATFPGIAIAVAVIAFNLLGDGLGEALDPHRSPNRAPPTLNTER